MLVIQIQNKEYLQWVSRVSFMNLFPAKFNNKQQQIFPFQWKEGCVALSMVWLQVDTIVTCQKHLFCFVSVLSSSSAILMAWINLCLPELCCILGDLKTMKNPESSFSLVNGAKMSNIRPIGLFTRSWHSPTSTI